MRAAERQVWKFQLGLTGTHTDIGLPRGSEVLCAQAQNNLPCIWVQVNDVAAETEKRRFYALCTGQPMPHDAGAYIGTVQLSGGALVLHVYEQWKG